MHALYCIPPAQRIAVWLRIAYGSLCCSYSGNPPMKRSIAAAKFRRRLSDSLRYIIPEPILYTMYTVGYRRRDQSQQHMTIVVCSYYYVLVRRNAMITTSQRDLVNSVVLICTAADRLLSRTRSEGACRTARRGNRAIGWFICPHQGRHTLFAADHLQRPTKLLVTIDHSLVLHTWALAVSAASHSLLTGYLVGASQDWPPTSFQATAREKGWNLDVHQEL